MVMNYIIIALRSILRQKGYSAINIVGLALGLSCCLLMLLYVADELSFDRFHANAHRIYRVHEDIRFAGQEFKIATAPPPMAQAIMNDIPEVELIARIRNVGEAPVKIGTTSFSEDVMYADNEIFSLFTIPMLAGNTTNALSDPGSVVITDELAHKYFGSVNAALGKSITIWNKQTFTVQGVVKKMPQNSHFQIGVLISMKASDEAQQTSWLGNNFHTYLRLREGEQGVLIASAQAKLDGFLQKYLAPQMREQLRVDLPTFLSAGNSWKASLHTLTGIHLYSHRVDELGRNGNIQYVRIASGVAILILLIAAANFMNLSTARAAKRAREVGLRKTLGANRLRLIVQFLAESLLMVCLAMLIALVVVEVVMPKFQDLAGKIITIPYLSSFWFWSIVAALVAITGVFAGLYPAFVLSGYQPVAVLKGSFFRSKSGNILRSSLVVSQFVASIVLIIGVGILFRQMDYIRNKNLGFSREQVLVIEQPYLLKDAGVQTLKNELAKTSGVQHITMSSYFPVPSNRNDSPISTSPVVTQGC